MLPSFFGNAIAAEQLLETIDPALKKRLADDALSAAKALGANYCVCVLAAICDKR
ncbi:MAG: hypothetical protein U1F19_00540 [Lysobacterales bacterium]